MVINCVSGEAASCKRHDELEMVGCSNLLNEVKKENNMMADVQSSPVEIHMNHIAALVLVYIAAVRSAMRPWIHSEAISTDQINVKKRAFNIFEEQSFASDSAM